ncbi:MAG: DNA helicase-2/ATP-dependent DNA helicase PcrA [Candidatus Poriferisodalaceae bacterium]|jgi:DNA helicase-2/ATP-dependent DNA helicase PcrA
MRLDQLDEQQRVAVETEAEPLRILAGPGSGKTRVLTHRIALRSETGSLDPRRVLALTFTRRAAGELRTRLYRLGIRDLGAVGTFHGVALAQLRRHRLDNGRRPPTVLASRRPLLNDLCEGDPSLAGGLHLGTLTSEVDWACAQGLTADEYAHGEGRRRVGRPARDVARLIEAYHAIKRRKGVFDFDDLLLECAHLLRTDEPFRNAQQWLFRHVFVDEFQDLNSPQFELMRAWVGDRTDLCIVGDPDQAIYGWNGADAGFLTEFEKVFPGCSTVHLLSNHRSAPAIVAAADAILDREPTPTSRHPSTTVPTVTSYDTHLDEAAGVARHIRWNRAPGTRWGSWAVLARTNDQLTQIATALEAVGVPARVRGKGGMLQLPAVVALVDTLIAAGQEFRAAAFDAAAQFLDGRGPTTPAARIAELALEFANEDPRASGEGFKTWLRTIRPGDLEGSHDAVDLVTFHAAKGLEWTSVVIAGVEVGYVPLKTNDPEERRLFYVAVSRAEQHLHLTWARTRIRNGSVENREPSPWLELIQATTIDPAPVAQGTVNDHLADARSATTADQTSRGTVSAGNVSGDNLDAAILDALTQWRAATARARRVSPGGLLRDKDLRAIARARPNTLEGLMESTGHSRQRLERLAPAIIATLAGAT